MKRALPKVQVEDYETPAEFLLSFYQELGWDPERQELDPRLIWIHPKAWAEICSALRCKWGVAAALAWMNSGPCGNESNPHNLARDELKMEEGALIDLRSAIQIE